MLQDICKDCSRVLLDDNERRTFLKRLRNPSNDNLARTTICKKINDQCRKAKNCPHCGAIQGTVKKTGPIKISHDRFRAYNSSTAAKKVMPEAKMQFDKSFAEAKRGNADLDKHAKKAMDDLNPLKVLHLFQRVIPADCELLGLNPKEGRPEMFIWQYVPAPPVCIRPSVQQDSASNEDDLTVKLTEIIFMSSMIRTGLQKGQPVQTLMVGISHKHGPKTHDANF
jgi:DNA-directed RNA polymerase III subunit RPC1